MKIYIGCDHAGYELKEKLRIYLTDLGHEVEDKGAFKYDPDDDYPDFIKPVAQSVINNKGSMGIILGASGQGEAMCANKVEGIRCALYYGNTGSQVDMSGNTFGMVASTREHNDANILSLGARFMSEDEAKIAVKTFLETPFSREVRHERRINKM